MSRRANAWAGIFLGLYGVSLFAVAVVAGWAWLAIASYTAYRIAPSPDL